MFTEKNINPANKENTPNQASEKAMENTSGNAKGESAEAEKIHIPALRKKTKERPTAKLSNAPESVVQNGKLTETAIYILNTMSGVDIDLLKAVTIKIKPVGEFPFYSPWKGGGAITIGETIAFTENFFDRTNYYYEDFSTYKDKYGNETFESDDVYANDTHRIYYSHGNEPMVWLDLLSHEVRHLAQAKAFGTDEKGIKKYKRFFAGQYIKYLGHNRVPFEKTAEEGSYVFGKVVVDQAKNQYSVVGQKMKNIMENKLISDADKKILIEALLSTKTTDEAIKKFRKEYQSAHPKKYKKEAKQKEKAEEKRDERTSSDVDPMDFDIIELENLLEELRNEGK